jgi:hypothetical protein
MDAHPADTRSAEQIESEIEKTRNEMAGTLGSLQRSLSPGQLVDQALGYLDEKSGQLGSGLVQTMKDNPLPTALACVGLAWLAVAGLGHGSVQPALSERRLMRERRADGSAGAAQWRTYHAAGAGVGEETSLPLERRRSQRRSDSLGRQMAASPEESQGREITGMARRNAWQAGRGVWRQAGQFVDRQPLVLGALGLAVGAAIGASLPATREENRLMGEARDEWLRQAKDTGGTALREARQRIGPTMADPMPAQPQAGHASGHPEAPGVVPGPGGFGAAPRPAPPP